jgi:ketosteroid isomerase-like protein
MPPRIAEVLERFVAGFNNNDLDNVMGFFSDLAVYRPGDGNEFRGAAAIRAAFLPQFSQAFGEMQFLVDDRVVDEGARKAAIRWVCKHDFDRTRSPLMRWLFKARYGKRAGWYGTDIFHFDEQGKIVGKYSYANFGPRPHLRRDLG